LYFRDGHDIDPPAVQAANGSICASVPLAIVGGAGWFPYCGAQARSVPSRNGSVTVAPDGGQSTQAGAGFDGAAAAPAGTAAAGDNVLLLGVVVEPAVAALVAPGIETEEGASVPLGALVAVCATAGATNTKSG
jgi:hypothetical protein